MDDLIRQIYGGFDRFPADLVGIDSPKFINGRDKCHTLYNAFRSRLPLELQADFDSLMDAQLSSLVVGQEEGFVSGFRVGVRLMIEALLPPTQEGI